MALHPIVPFLLLISVIGISLSVHKVDEGNVGVYWRGGALVNRITDPGYHLKVPFVDQFENVQVTIQTDKVTNIPCGTSGGVMLTIDKVEVVNRLKREYVFETIKNYTIHYDKIWIFDKIHHEINQFCSKHTLQEVYIDMFHDVDDLLGKALQSDADKWAPGVEIIAVRITKPNIPNKILANYEAMEAEKTKLLIVTQNQYVVTKEAETDRMKATIEAEKKAAVAKIEIEQKILEKQALQKMKKIEDEMLVDHEKAMADALHYELTRVAQANQALLTPEYLSLKSIEAISNNTKIYFGKDINSMFLDFLSGYITKDKIIEKEKKETAPPVPQKRD